MAQFYGEMQGNRCAVSRMGTKRSGFWAHIRGWDIGCRVELEHRNGKDMMRVYQTNGSNSPGDRKLIAEVIYDKGC